MMTTERLKSAGQRFPYRLDSGSGIGFKADAKAAAMDVAAGIEK
jgi:hypothetical protein